MTVHVVISCRECDNERWVLVPRAGKNPVPKELEDAEDAGWQIGTGMEIRDYCPDCAGNQ